MKIGAVILAAVVVAFMVHCGIGVWAISQGYEAWFTPTRVRIMFNALLLLFSIIGLVLAWPFGRDEDEEIDK